MSVPTGSKRQLAWVFDLNKCIGCQTCSVACKVQWPRDDPGTESMWWMTVNTQPGRGMPRDWETMGGGYVDGRLQIGREPTEDEIGGGWDFNYDEVLNGGRGRNARFHAVSGNPNWGMNWDEDEGGGQYPNSYFFYLPRLCAHCTKPACVEACPHDAVFKRDEDGLVLIDEALCLGDRSCIGACPYKKIDFNRTLGISQKCIGCFPRVDHGVAPVCVRSCPARAAFVGFLDDEHSPVHKLVRRWNVALPLHPEFGVEPNVYYVPPLAPQPLHPDGSTDEAGDRIPPAYLESLFGPAVHEALATLKGELESRRGGRPSDLLDTLILYHWQEALGHLRRDPADIDWASESMKGGRQ
jgi:ethylbenzene hydroxylase subunit beta/complex iron-sulfur molybdoenzyme family reductase subunit beta